MNRVTFAALLAAAAFLLGGCGQILEDTYRRAEKFGDGLRDFTTSRPEPPAVSLPEPSAGAETPLPEPSPDYYRQHLTAEQQQEYDRFLEAVESRQKSVQTTLLDSALLTPVLRAVYFDHPECFWMQNGGTFYRSGSRGEYHFLYPDGQDVEQMQKEIDNAAKAFLQSVPSSASEYEKVRAVFEFLVDTVEYDAGSANSSNLYGALVEKKAVCEGYTRAAQYLLGKLGVFATIALGDTLDDQPHSWNLVRIDGEFYYMDVTWGDPSFAGEQAAPGYRNYAYLCAATDDLLRSRTIDETYAAMPQCTATEYQYFTRTGRLLDSFPRNAGKLLADGYRAGEAYVPLQFTTDALYQQAVSQLLEEKQVYALLAAEGINLGEIRYLTDETMRTITIQF